MTLKEEAESASNELLDQERARTESSHRLRDRFWVWMYNYPELWRMRPGERNDILRQAETSFYDRWQTRLAFAALFLYMAALLLKALPDALSAEAKVVGMAIGAMLIAIHRTNYIRRYVARIMATRAK